MKHEFCAPFCVLMLLCFFYFRFHSYARLVSGMVSDISSCCHTWWNTEAHAATCRWETDAHAAIYGESQNLMLPKGRMTFMFTYCHIKLMNSFWISCCHISVLSFHYFGAFILSWIHPFFATISGYGLCTPKAQKLIFVRYPPLLFAPRFYNTWNYLCSLFPGGAGFFTYWRITFLKNAVIVVYDIFFLSSKHCVWDICCNECLCTYIYTYIYTLHKHRG